MPLLLLVVKAEAVLSLLVVVAVFIEAIVEVVSTVLLGLVAEKEAAVAVVDVKLVKVV